MEHSAAKGPASSVATQETAGSMVGNLLDEAATKLRAEASVDEVAFAVMKCKELLRALSDASRAHDVVVPVDLPALIDDLSRWFMILAFRIGSDAMTTGGQGAGTRDSVALGPGGATAGGEAEAAPPAPPASQPDPVSTSGGWAEGGATWLTPGDCPHHPNVT